MPGDTFGMDRSTSYMRAPGSESSSAASSTAAPQDVHAELRTVREREQRLMELLECRSPERLEHDLRNVLNELHLLRRMLD